MLHQYMNVHLPYVKKKLNEEKLYFDGIFPAVHVFWIQNYQNIASSKLSFVSFELFLMLFI